MKKKEYADQVNKLWISLTTIKWQEQSANNVDIYHRCTIHPLLTKKKSPCSVELEFMYKNSKSRYMQAKKKLTHEVNHKYQQFATNESEKKNI